MTHTSKETDPLKSLHAEMLKEENPALGSPYILATALI
jgi:hypothetical protein